mgnify:CR=1 FL=1
MSTQDPRDPFCECDSATWCAVHGTANMFITDPDQLAAAEACGRAEGYQQAITDLRDCDAFAAWKASQPKPSQFASPAYVHHREAAETAEYLEQLAKERTP